MISDSRNESLVIAELARTITISAISQTAKRREKKYPKLEFPTNFASKSAAIIELKPNPKIAESNSSMACNRLPLLIARGIAMKAKG